MSSKNSNLHKARTAKNDEFYTQLTDIEKEMVHYKEHFRGKVVYCNCDDPMKSNFFQYFGNNFEALGLKKLITTHYGDNACVMEYHGDQDGNKVPDEHEISVRSLEGDGDFRSEECINLLKEADIVVTNPPFSLFREYIAQLVEYDKKFLIVGPLNAVKYKEIFPLIMAGKVWLGVSNGSVEFEVPQDYDLRISRLDDEGKRFTALGNIRWFTNLDHKKRHEPLDLCWRYDAKKYPELDNYYAINVGKVIDIPYDYERVVAVPITFLDKWNPDQFEVLGITRSWYESEGLLKHEAKSKEAFLNGKEVYTRFLIQKRPQS